MAGRHVLPSCILSYGRWRAGRAWHCSGLEIWQICAMRGHISWVKICGAMMTTSTTTMTTLARRLQWRSFQTEMRFVWMFEFGTEIGLSIAAIVSKLLKDSQIQSFRMCARLRICKCLRSKILVVVKMHCVCRYWSALACVRSCRIVFSWGIVPSNCY